MNGYSNISHSAHELVESPLLQRFKRDAKSARKNMASDIQLASFYEGLAKAMGAQSWFNLRRLLNGDSNDFSRKVREERNDHAQFLAESWDIDLFTAEEIVCAAIAPTMARMSTTWVEATGANECPAVSADHGRRELRERHSGHYLLPDEVPATTRSVSVVVRRRGARSTDAYTVQSDKRHAWRDHHMSL
jgi:hypothetical protein